MTDIRLAREDDLPALRHIHETAFPAPVEAQLVERLVAAGHDELSLVAEQDGQPVAHILFSPVTIERDGQAIATGLGLAPVAVLPAYQKQGIGTALITAGLQALAAAGCPFVVVLGHPEYYRRFGFVTASEHQLANEYGVDEPFMVIELTPPALPPGGGLVKYGPEFADL